MESKEEEGEGSCCQRMARVLKEQFEKRFEEMEERVRKAEHDVREYLEKLKKCIVLRDEKLLAT